MAAKTLSCSPIYAQNLAKYLKDLKPVERRERRKTGQREKGDKGGKGKRITPKIRKFRYRVVPSLRIYPLK